jgi:polyisoprenoid-binding protein YceI
MKNIVLLLAILGLTSLSFTNPADLTGAMDIDKEKSQIVWRGYKVTGKHHGTVGIESGSLNFEEGVLTGGTFEIDMASIAVKDIEGEWAGKLEGHLKSDDFFGVANYPTAKFVITKVYPKGTPGDYKITGALTIKETTKEIKFYATVKEEGETATATANITIDRTDFDVRYGSGNFFENLGDKTIYDEFDLEISLVTAAK